MAGKRQEEIVGLGDVGERIDRVRGAHASERLDGVEPHVDVRILAARAISASTARRRLPLAERQRGLHAQAGIGIVQQRRRAAPVRSTSDAAEQLQRAAQHVEVAVLVAREQRASSRGERDATGRERRAPPVSSSAPAQDPRRPPRPRPRPLSPSRRRAAPRPARARASMPRGHVLDRRHHARRCASPSRSGPSVTRCCMRSK